MDEATGRLIGPLRLVQHAVPGAAPHPAYPIGRPTMAASAVAGAALAGFAGRLRGRRTTGGRRSRYRAVGPDQASTVRPCHCASATRPSVIVALAHVDLATRRVARCHRWQCEDAAACAGRRLISQPCHQVLRPKDVAEPCRRTLERPTTGSGYWHDVTQAPPMRPAVSVDADVGIGLAAPTT